LTFRREGLALAKRHREQGDRLVELHAAGEQALLVERVASQQVIAEHAVGPDAELGAAPRLDPVADGDHDVQVVARRRAATVRGSMQNLHRTLSWQLALGEHVSIWRAITDWPRPNSSTICACVSQTVSSPTMTSTLTSDEQ